MTLPSSSRGEVGDWASNWVRVFVSASKMLPPGGYSLPARRLLAAASHASVFGGMGSWNDLGVAPSQQAEYDRVTQNLPEAVKRSLVAAANSFDPSLVARAKQASSRQAPRVPLAPSRHSQVYS